MLTADCRKRAVSAFSISHLAFCISVPAQASVPASPDCPALLTILASSPQFCRSSAVERHRSPRLLPSLSLNSSGTAIAGQSRKFRDITVSSRTPNTGNRRALGGVYEDAPPDSRDRNSAGPPCVRWGADDHRSEPENRLDAG